MKYKLTITEDIIDRSIPSSCTECVIATTIRELVPCEVMVSGINYLDRESYKVTTARELTMQQRKLMEMFDDGMNVLGRTIEVDIPDSVIAMHYNSAVEAAMKIANSPSIKQLNHDYISP